MAGCPSSILENWKPIFLALHARAAWSQDGHRHQSLHHLMEVSRTLADPSFIVFCCVFADLFAGGLSPFAHQVQGILEPSEFKRCERRAMRFIAKFKAFLPRLRGLLRVVSLLRQHVPEDDLSSLVKAYGCGSTGRCFPTLFDALPELLASMPTFRGPPSPQPLPPNLTNLSAIRFHLSTRLLSHPTPPTPPHCTATPHRTTPHRATPHCIALHRTPPHCSTPHPTPHSPTPPHAAPPHPIPTFADRSAGSELAGAECGPSQDDVLGAHLPM